ncbi:MAG: MFS transporter [Bryobacteraceae bacterium]|nr:MFS transporter [Bryobacteraceae bacterium]
MTTAQTSAAVLEISSVGDVSRLINTETARLSHARIIVFLALGGVFLDAYDLTTLSYGIQDVAKDFHLRPALTGVVASSIMIGTIFGGLIGGWFTDKIGRYHVFMADMVFFVVAALVAGFAPNVWVLIVARFVMGLGVGIDLPVAMAFLTEFSKFSGKGNKASRLAAWCPMWYAASSVCFFIVFGLYFLLPAVHADWLWRGSLIFGAAPALAIILVRYRYMNESPLWAAQQGDFERAVHILRQSYGIEARDASYLKPSDVKPPSPSLRILFRRPYLWRTLVASSMNLCIPFEYTAIAFFLPAILSQFLGANVFTTISASLVLNLLFAFTGGLLGIRLARSCPSRHVAITGFVLQVIALVTLALLGHPTTALAIGLAVTMLGLWLFAEGFGPGAQGMIYPALSYPTAIRGTAIGFGRSLSGSGSALSLFILPILKAKLGTDMFWVVSISAFIPILFLLAIRYEPTQHDIDQTEFGSN